MLTNGINSDKIRIYKSIQCYNERGMECMELLQEIGNALPEVISWLEMILKFALELVNWFYANVYVVALEMFGIPLETANLVVTIAAGGYVLMRILKIFS